MKKMKEYFTTGEFAKICNVKKQTLFHYDEIGIFKPEITAPNGYRYYSYTQIETFGVLNVFKELKVPLKEVKRHMDSRSPEALIDLLDKKKNDIDMMIKRLESARIYVDEKIKITKEGMNAPLGEIVFEDIPDEYLITTDYAGTDNERAVAEAVSEHFNFCKSLGITSTYAIGGMIDKASVTDTGYKYSKFYTVINPGLSQNLDSSRASLDTGGRYIAIYDNHGYENIHTLCQTLLNYAEKENLRLDKWLYEDVILDDLSVNGYYNYMVKISARVL